MELHIIKDLQGVYHAQNLLNPADGTLVFKVWPTSIDRVFLGEEPREYFIATFLNENFYKPSTAVLVDENGEEALPGEFQKIDVWEDGQYNELGPILRVTYKGEDGERLISLKGNFITEKYHMFQRRGSLGLGYISAYRKENGILQLTFLTYPGFKRISPEWFDKENIEKAYAYRHEDGFVSVVKHNNRFKILYRDGTLKPIQKEK